MFTPKTTKYRKFRKVKVRKFATKDHTLSFGDFGLKAKGFAKLNGKQIESARRVITRVISKSGKLWIRCFPNIPVTKKPTDVRMGGGKGSVDSYIFPVYPGRIVFELSGVSEETAKLALLKAGAKLPFSVSVVSRVEL